MRDIKTLVQEIEDRTEELFKEVEEAKVWEVRCVIKAVHHIGEKKLIDRDRYNIPIVGIECEVGKPFRVFYEKGGFFIHQKVTAPPEEDNCGFWIRTTTKIWRFDYN